MPAADAVVCFHFGADDAPLFGCYHPPASGVPRSSAVVLCPPAGRDYVFAHRAFRRLAIGLAGAGLPVLRFDYSGCGDSAGDGEQGGIARWTADTGLAVDTLKARSGATHVCLVGFRLGASLAALAATQRRDVDALVLWDPVVDGAAHLAMLQQSHTRWWKAQGWAPADMSGAESLGFPLPASLQAELRTLDLRRLPAGPVQRALLLAGADAPGTDDCRQTLERQGAAVALQHIDWPEYAAGLENLADVLMPPVPILRAVVAWTSGACP